MSLRIVEKIEGFEALQQRAIETQTADQGYDYKKGDVQHYVNMRYPKRIRVTVTDVIAETPSTKTFRLVSPDGYLPPFQAGQYISLYLEIDGVQTCRPYSISSAPQQRTHYDITVKATETGFVSRYVNEALQPGSELECSAPYGQFHYNPVLHGDSLVLIGGGSGITPLMSMIRDFTNKQSAINLQLIYGSATLDDVIFRDALAELERENEHLSITHVISDPPSGYQGEQGFISEQVIRRTVGNIEDKTFFLCGPPVMYNFCRAELEKLGVDNKRIRKEVFGPPADATLCEGWPAHIKADTEFQITIKDGPVIPALAGEPLLVAFERAKHLIPAICRTGQCSMCRIKIESGDVFAAPYAGHRTSDDWFGYAHSCMTYPLSNLQVRL